MKGMTLTTAILGLVLGLVAGPGRADWPNTMVKWDNHVEDVDDWAGASFINPDAGVTGGPPEALSADDFMCTSSLPIIEIDFAGWCDTGSQRIESFRVTFWSDVPATVDDESHPGDLLYDELIAKADPADRLKLGWQDLGENTFRINLREEQWFWQEGSPTQPVTYWIGIQGMTAEDDYDDLFYWRFASRHVRTWGDDAAFTSEWFGNPGWWNWGFADPLDDELSPEVYDGPFPIDWVKSADMAFSLSVPEPTAIGLMAVGGLGVLLRRRRRG